MPDGEMDVGATLATVLHNIETGPDMGFIGTNIGLLTRATIGLNDKVDRGFARVDTRFDQVDARFDQVDARFDQVDARFDQVDARFAQLEATVGNMDIRLGILGDDVRKMSARMEQLFGLIAKDELKGKKK